MLLNGSYVEAKDLKPFDSLMPLYRSYQSRDGYERIKTTKGNGILTHKMVAEYYFGKRKETEIIHHKDEEWFNNDPTNIEYKDAGLHSKDHRIGNALFKTKGFKEKRLETLKQKGFYNKKYKEKKKATAVKNIEMHNKSPQKKEQDKLAGQRGKEYLIKYNKSKKGRGKSSENGKKYGFGRSNHKVLFTQTTEKREDVYCLTVEKYHNFALAAGVFVHNCGMCAVKTNLTELDTDTLKNVMSGIRKAIPVGFSHHQTLQPNNFVLPGEFGPIISQEEGSIDYQIGTLGGGNHFIEIQKDNNQNIWIMLHSGSRNLGFKVARYYNDAAMAQNKRWFSIVPKEYELAFLPIDSNEARVYLIDMNICIDFALHNRKIMIEKICNIFNDNVPNFGTITKLGDELGIINIAHNYAALENHFGQNVMVHRKGATLARKGAIGIIPGSQGTKSYIVRGLGNKNSFESCSHGAGRVMGRKQAIKELNFNDVVDKLDKKGIIHSIRTDRDLDEAPEAYKDIDTVMENQKDLVEIVECLTPIAVIKG